MENCIKKIKANLADYWTQKKRDDDDDDCGFPEMLEKAFAMIRALEDFIEKIPCQSESLANLRKYPNLYQRFELLNLKDRKTQLEVAEFEHLYHLRNFLSSVDAFEAGSLRNFKNGYDRANFIETVEKLVKNFVHNEKWLQNS